MSAIDGSLAALNRGDFDTFAGYYSKDFVFEEPDLLAPPRGRDEFLRYNEHLQRLGARYYRIGPVIQNGNAAAYAISCPPCPGGWSGMDLVRFDDDLKIVHLWDIGSES